MSKKLPPFGINQYPPEYNIKIHGPYSLARNYGPVDTRPFDVKLNELSSWLGRRNYSVLHLARYPFRAFHRWSVKWLVTRRGWGAGVCQFIFIYSIGLYLTSYPNSIRYHKHCKYH